MIIGISGKSGSGKSSISKYLEKNYHYYWIDTDRIAAYIRKEYLEEIVSFINDDSVINGNDIDSKKLGSILFKNKELLKVYNDFIYEKMKNKIDELVKEKPNVIIDSLFLPIMDIYKECDYTILVKCKDQLRKERIIKRDNIEEQYYLDRDSNGLEYRDSDFDFIIDNTKDYKIQLKEILNRINS